MTLGQQYDIFWKQITTRKRNPVKPATLAAYQSYWRNHINPYIGQLDVSKVENGVMKNLVSQIAHLSPSTIAGVTQLVKGVVASAVDDNGNQLFPKTWNSLFIDAPQIQDQNAPIMGRAALETALRRTQGQFRTLCTLAAGTGCRISELLALKIGSRLESSFWDPEGSKLVIQKALWRGKEQSTKTKAGEREIDLCPELNNYLVDEIQAGNLLFHGSKGQPLRIKTIYDLATKAGIPGFHSLRRYRVTFLRSQRVPEDIIKFWIGHSANKSITDRYCKMADDIILRKKFAAEVGLGFQLPTSKNENPLAEEMADQAAH